MRSVGPVGPVCRHVGNPKTCTACAAETTSEQAYEVMAEHGEPNMTSRTELRKYEDGTLVMAYLRPRVGGGWYVRDSISLPSGKGSSNGQTPDPAPSIRSAPAPDAQPVPNGGSRTIEGVDDHE